MGPSSPLLLPNPLWIGPLPLSAASLALLASPAALALAVAVWPLPEGLAWLAPGPGAGYPSLVLCQG